MLLGRAQNDYTLSEEVIAVKRCLKVSDPEEGDFYINPDTGEVLSIQGECIIISPREAVARHAASKRYRKVLASKKSPTLGDFCWIKVPCSGELLPGISGNDAARLLYLATYANYNGQLYCGRRRISYKDLPGLLGIRSREAYHFRASVAPFLEADSLGDLSLRGDIFHRGALTSDELSSAERTGARYIRMYFPAFQQLYQSPYEGCRELLRLLNKLLPLLHPYRNFFQRSYAVGCADGQALSWRQLCIALGRNPTNAARDKSTLLSAKFQTPQGVEAAVFQSDGKIYLNPRLFFAGNQGALEYLQPMFSCREAFSGIGTGRPKNPLRSLRVLENKSMFKGKDN